jgi:YVTN family beta-propeller protein
VAVEIALRSRKAYIANYNSGNITVLDTESLTVEGWLNSNRSIRDMALDPFSEMLYCVIEQLNSVTLLKERLNIDIAEILTEARPFRTSFDPERSYLYVIHRETDSVTIINKTLRRVQGSIATGRKPYAILFP